MKAVAGRIGAGQAGFRGLADEAALIPLPSVGQCRECRIVDGVADADAGADGAVRCDFKRLAPCELAACRLRRQTVRHFPDVAAQAVIVVRRFEHAVDVVGRHLKPDKALCGNPWRHAGGEDYYPRKRDRLKDGSAKRVHAHSLQVEKAFGN